MVIAILLGLLIVPYLTLTAVDRVSENRRIAPAWRGRISLALVLCFTGLLVPWLSRLTGICLVIFLILVLPANFYAAMQRVGIGGHSAGPTYLLLRVPLQLILIGWTYWFAVRQTGTAAQAPSG
jgi:uncharacterized membrane protein